MTTTGTLAPPLSQREYTEDEKTVLLHFFTNLDRNIYAATDAMSSQLYAFLTGQYSRSALSMRDRFLKLFSDSEKRYQEGKIKRAEFVSLTELAEEIRSNETQAIEFFNKKASLFLKKWGVDYGHNSLKDADRIRYAIENVSQVFTKVIEAPFPPLGDFQEKSTRYVSFDAERVIYPPKLEASEHFPEIKANTEKLLELYQKYTPVVREFIIAEKIIQESDFKSPIAFKNTLNAKVFDTMRYLLPSSITTSLGASLSSRIAEMHISEMLSHPLEEVREIAQAMHEEGLKVTPGLLSHVSENDYLQNKRASGQKLIEELLKDQELPTMRQGLEDSERVKIIEAEEIEEKIMASIIFENGRTKGVSYSECLARAQSSDDQTKAKIIASELAGRGRFDRMPRSLQHGSIMIELLTDFGAYRDYQRHRASGQIWQGVTAIHGYDYPELIDHPDLAEFRREYDQVMSATCELARKLITRFPYEIEYVAALGHLIRTTFECNPGQLAYVIELRTTPQGHYSYRRLFQEVYRQIKAKAPIFAKYIRVNEDFEASRLKQEERSAEKRRGLGLE
jgi:thymidylate synthase ThyX